MDASDFVICENFPAMVELRSKWSNGAVGEMIDWLHHELEPAIHVAKQSDEWRAKERR